MKHQPAGPECPTASTWTLASIHLHSGSSSMVANRLTGTASRSRAIAPKTSRVLVFALPMELVQHPMQDGREDHADRDHEHEARIQRVQAGEDLPAGRRGRLHRPFATEEHGRVQERVAPPQLLEVVIADH